MKKIFITFLFTLVVLLGYMDPVDARLVEKTITVNWKEVKAQYDWITNSYQGYAQKSDGTYEHATPPTRTSYYKDDSGNLIKTTSVPTVDQNTWDVTYKNTDTPVVNPAPINSSPTPPTSAPSDSTPAPAETESTPAPATATDSNSSQPLSDLTPVSVAGNKVTPVVVNSSASNPTSVNSSSTNILWVDDQDLKDGNVDMNTIPLVIVSVISTLLAVAGTVAVFSLIYHAVQMQINSGITWDSSGVDKAKKWMIGALIGFVIAIAAWFLVTRAVELLTNIT